MYWDRIPTLVIALYHRLRAWNLRIFVVSNLNRVNILMICVIMVMYIDIFYVMKNIVRVSGHLL